MNAPVDATPSERLAAFHRQVAHGARLRRWTYGGYLLCLVVIGSAIAPPTPRLVWNASASAPLGLYRVSPATVPRRGDMALARVPLAYRRLAAVRHYLPENVPLVKRVAGSSGDRVCAAGALLTVNGTIVARRLSHDQHGRAMPRWRGCRVLRAGEYLLLMVERPDSFDGRYFGVTSGADMIGQARLLWRG